MKSQQKYSEYAYLEFLYLKPVLRGQGLNQSVLQKFMAWAKSQKLTEARLPIYDENAIAKNAYAKAGFKPNLLEI